MPPPENRFGGGAAQQQHRRKNMGTYISLNLVGILGGIRMGNWEWLCITLLFVFWTRDDDDASLDGNLLPCKQGKRENLYNRGVIMHAPWGQKLRLVKMARSGNIWRYACLVHVMWSWCFLVPSSIWVDWILVCFYASTSRSFAAMQIELSSVIWKHCTFFENGLENVPKQILVCCNTTNNCWRVCAGFRGWGGMMV